ncbi:MAG: SprT family zinc-dependent metalloprotease [Synergistaceae bacterium]
MSETITIKDTLFELRTHPLRKNIAVGMTLEGKYFVSAPSSISKEQIINTIEDKIREIIKDLEAKTAGKLEKPYSYSEGELFLFKGIYYPLTYDKTSTHKFIKFTGNEFVLSAKTKNDFQSLFENFYTRKLKEELNSILPKWSEITGVTPNKISIKNAKRLWGSCSSKKNITFSTRLALVPQRQMEYVIVHELCHIKEMNHSKLFWEEVAKYIPDYKEQRNELKQHTHKYKWW